MSKIFKSLFVHAFFIIGGLLYYMIYGFEKAVIVCLALIVTNVVLLNKDK